MTEVEGVVRSVLQDALTKRYRILLEDGSEFGVPIDRKGLGRDMQAAHRVLTLIGSRVRFPVRADGSIAARPERVHTVEDEASVEVAGHPGNDAEPPKADERLPRDEPEQPPWEVAWEREMQQPEQPPQAEAELPPWDVAELARTETRTVQRDVGKEMTVAEQPPWERIERKIDDIPLAVANLMGTGPVQEAERITAEEGETA